MPISGWIVTLASDADQAARALRELCSHPCIELGAAAPGAMQRFPVVVDTPDEAQNEALWVWLGELPGVLHVDVVCAYPEPPLPAGLGSSPALPTARDQSFE